MGVFWQLSAITMRHPDVFRHPSCVCKLVAGNLKKGAYILTRVWGKDSVPRSSASTTSLA